jgi:hypothetical protein
MVVGVVLIMKMNIIMMMQQLSIFVAAMPFTLVVSKNTFPRNKMMSLLLLLLMQQQLDWTMNGSRSGQVGLEQQQQATTAQHMQMVMWCVVGVVLYRRCSTTALSSTSPFLLD